MARLTDRLEGDSFDDVDRVCAQKFARHAEVALANALRFRSLEKLSLEDPISGAYTAQYFQDVVRNEIEKSNRFGRSFALCVELDLGPLEAARLAVGDGGVQAFLSGVTEELTRLLRAADLLAAGGEGRFCVLLAEADALGAAVLKRRALQALGASELFTRLGAGARPIRTSEPPSIPGTGPASKRCCACSANASRRNARVPCAASASTA